MAVSPKRFKVALSFSGKHRAFIKRVAQRLSQDLTSDCVLYDEYHRAEFAVPDLDLHLQELYQREAELIAIFLSAGYKGSDWCGLEWRALRSLIMQRRGRQIMLLRFDDTEIPGIHPTDGYIWIGEQTSETIAETILNRSKQGDDDDKPSYPPLVQYDPPLVALVFGEAAAKSEQISLGQTLSLHHIKHRTYSFRLPASARRNVPDQRLGDFQEFYHGLLNDRQSQIDIADYQRRPSLIAYGAGAVIVGSAMQKFQEIQFDKIIMCDSTLPANFDWSRLFHRDQVNFVRYEFSGGNSNPGSAHEPGIVASSNLDGFYSASSVVTQERFEDFVRSDYFRPQHVERFWLPVLRKEPSPLMVLHGRNMKPSMFIPVFEQTGLIDEACFKDLPDFREIPDELAKSWIAEEPDIYTFLLDRREAKARGYINAMPVTDDCFEAIMRGEKDDPDIEDSDVVHLLGQQTVKFYLMSVAIDLPLRQGYGLFPEPVDRLVNGFINKLYHYAVQSWNSCQRNRFCRLDEPGKKLCKHWE